MWRILSRLTCRFFGHRFPPINDESMGDLGLKLKCGRCDATLEPFAWVKTGNDDLIPISKILGDATERS